MNDALTQRINEAFARMPLLGAATSSLRTMVDSVLESTDDADLRDRLADELELAADENEELVTHLRQVHIAGGERLNGARPSDTEIDGVAASAAFALSRARRRLLALASELRALRRWSRYRFAWEEKLIKRRFPPAPKRRNPPTAFEAALVQLDDAFNQRRQLILEISAAEAKWSLRLLREREFMIRGLWWKSSRRWIAYQALRHAVSIVLTVVVGVFLVNALTQDLEYLWGCAVAVLVMIAQHLLVSSRIRRALTERRTQALGDGAMHWAFARVFAAVTTTAVELSWRRVRDEEQKIPDDPLSGVAV